MNEDMKLRKGSHDATGLRFGIVVAKFNKFVTSKLLSILRRRADQTRG